MSETVNIHYAKTHLSRLLARVREGAEIVIAKGGEPIARLVPVEQPAPRHPGGFAFHLGEEFFEPLPDEELEGWER
jgi:prevent-host-death family protein